MRMMSGSWMISLCGLVVLNWATGCRVNSIDAQVHGQVRDRAGNLVDGVRADVCLMVRFSYDRVKECQRVDVRHGELVFDFFDESAALASPGWYLSSEATISIVPKDKEWLQVFKKPVSGEVDLKGSTIDFDGAHLSADILVKFVVE